MQGEQRVFDYMRQLFPDWRARGLTSLLHEHESGFAFNKPAIQGIAGKAEVEGVRILSGVKVTGFEFDSSGLVRTVVTDQGNIDVEQVVVGAGPWTGQIWAQLGLPDKIDVRGTDGTRHRNRDMWTYWRLQEGEIRIDPEKYLTADGKVPPVFHFDSREPLVSLKTGRVITDGLWGIYWKQDSHGVQGGAEPKNLGSEAQIDPYGPESPIYTVKDDFVDQWTSGLAHAMERFENCDRHYHHAPSGGIGCFSADSFPVFDYAPDIPNVYVIADSNHGFKMISVGQEVARVLSGERSAVLHPFRYSRFAEGDLHPVSNSPYPWGDEKNMTDQKTKPGLLERLNQGAVICAEGYLFELERRGYVQAGAFVPEAVLDRPDAVLARSPPAGKRRSASRARRSSSRSNHHSRSRRVTSAVPG